MGRTGFSIREKGPTYFMSRVRPIKRGKGVEGPKPSRPEERRGFKAYRRRLKSGRKRRKSQGKNQVSDKGGIQQGERGGK